mmetsp:Transcript_28754/g.39750  ORF Transcript_28754/g.39750 Transcript_28754/m.39750 type:complete len:215 (-) Transcript_28754:178-822(-)
MPSTSTPCTRSSSALSAKSSKFSSQSSKLLKTCHRSVTTLYFPSLSLRHERSNTSRSFPTSATSSFSRARSSLPSRNTKEVTMTCEAPAWRYCAALSVRMPPPTCNPPGYARNALKAASFVASSALSMITWPPVRRSCWYIWANSAEDFSVSKLVTGSQEPSNPSPLICFKSFRVEPTICLTFPLWRSMQGRKFTEERVARAEGEGLDPPDTRH